MCRTKIRNESNELFILGTVCRRVNKWRVRPVGRNERLKGQRKNCEFVNCLKSRFQWFSGHGEREVPCSSSATRRVFLQNIQSWCQRAQSRDSGSPSWRDRLSLTCPLCRPAENTLLVGSRHSCPAVNHYILYGERIRDILRLMEWLERNGVEMVFIPSTFQSVLL